MLKDTGSPGWQSRISRLGCVLGMVLLASASAGAAPIVVDPNATACVTAPVHFTTIQEAIDAAPAGGTVQVCPGQYQEQISINKPLTLKGVGAGNGGVATILLPANFGPNTTLWLQPAVAQVLIQSLNVTLTNLVVDGSNPLDSCSTSPRVVGIFYDHGSSGAVKTVSVRNQIVSASGIDCRLGIGIQVADTSGVTVQDSDISNVDGAGVSLFGSSADVKANVIRVRSSATGVLVSTNVSGTVFGNFISGGLQGIFVQSWHSTLNVTIANNVIHFRSIGIQCHGCNGLTVSGNKFYGDSYADPYYGVFFWSYFEACNGGNLIQSNHIVGPSYGGIFIDCPDSDTIDQNILQDVIWGIAVRPGDAVTKNKFYNVTTNITTAN